MNCIACGGELEDVVAGENQPVGGTEFQTFGHYGSTVTDLMDGTRHIINVCDDCVRKALENGSCKVIGAHGLTGG